MLRPPAAPPRALPDDMLQPAQRIVIRHPDYPDDDSNRLFELECLDCVPPTASITEPGSRRGVQFALVHTACAIIAGNRFDGFLTTTTSSSAPRLAMDDGDILPSGTYYFRLPSSSSSPALPDLSPPYPIVPNFRQWAFPASGLPASWTRCPVAPSHHTKVEHRDGSCRITAHNLSTHVAHIVPDTEREWFVRHAMDRFRIITPQGRDILSAPENHLLLRQDVHFAWDGRKFGIVPKQDSDNRWHWTVHAHETSPPDLVTEYHNLRLQELAGVCREYLFARFAMDVFPRLIPFLQRDRKRFLSTAAHPAGIWCNAEDVGQFIRGQGPGRSESSPRRKGATSPSKRARSDQDAEELLREDGGGLKRRRTSPVRPRRSSEGGERELRCDEERWNGLDTGREHTFGCQTPSSDADRGPSLDSGLGSSFRSASKKGKKGGSCNNTEVNDDYEGSEGAEHESGQEQDGDEVEAAEEEVQLSQWLQRQQDFEEALAHDDDNYWDDPPRGRKRRRTTLLA